jgi:hypothetical protein
MGCGIAFETIDSVFKCEIMGLHLIRVEVSGNQVCKITKNELWNSYMYFTGVYIAAEKS